MTSVYTKQITSKKFHMLCQTNIGGGGDSAGVYQTENNRSSRRKITSMFVTLGLEQVGMANLEGYRSAGLVLSLS